MRKSAAASFFLAVFTLLGPGQAAQPSSTAATKSQNASPDVCAIAPGATVSDACASYADLDSLNARLNPLVHKLCTRTDFFSYYRLNLYNKVCPFWSDENGLCGNIACAVTTIENEEDIPDVWRAEELSRLEGPKAHHPGKKEQKERPQKPLQGELGENVGESCVVEYDDECDERDYCVPEDESASAKGDYVSLLDNPERFTGYAGEGAKQVWSAIYRENCFAKPLPPSRGIAGPLGNSPFGPLSGFPGKAAQDLKSVLKEHNRQEAMKTGGGLEDQLEFEDECLEKRVFHRVVSGMHASISTHLCHDYLNQSTGKWGPHLDCYKERLHNHPERISNLYFNFALVSRAVAKLTDYVQDYTFCTGDPTEDRRTKDMIVQLASQLPSGAEIFDETIMFQDGADPSQTAIELKEDFRNRFRNVSRIMDCVGCDKCRLWGKLQTNGYGTALKVLFEFGDTDTSKPKPTLRRTELVALINTLDKISNALKAVGRFRKMIEVEQEEATALSQKKPIADKPIADNPIAEKPTYAKDQPEEEDEDLEDFNTPPPAKPKRPDPTLREAFDQEFGLVWRATCYVVKSWITFPKTLWQILVIETARLWQRWLGLDVWPRSWEFHLPQLEDLYRDEL